VAETLITLGGLFLVGLLTDLLGRRTPLPRVTLLIGVGFLAGPSVADVLPSASRSWFPVAAHMALVMVGFLLGGSLTRQLRLRGRTILGVAGAKVVSTFAVVAVGLLLLGFGLEVSLLLAAVATATDPASVADVVREERAEGAFSETLLGVVAVDDAWGLMAFSIALALVEALGGGGGSALLIGLREVGGGLALGVVLGIPAALLTGRVEPGEPTLAEALGIVFLCGGLALWLDVSFLLASMALGATVAMLGRHHRRPFYAIEGIEWPFMILFFVLAGASLDVGALSGLGLLVVGYVVLRSVGTALGTSLGASALGAEASTRRWLGLALLPQAGVALGMALVAADRVPELRDPILHTTIAATLLFELGGPVLTRVALRRSGESQRV
jgi:Kef-type K+ transport system membrane component KefB